MRGLQPTDSGSRGARLIRPDWSLMPRGVELYSCCIYIAAEPETSTLIASFSKREVMGQLRKETASTQRPSIAQRREVYEAKDMLTARSGGRPCVARRLSEESVVRSCAGRRFPVLAGFACSLAAPGAKPCDARRAKRLGRSAGRGQRAATFHGPAISHLILYALASIECFPLPLPVDIFRRPGRTGRGGRGFLSLIP